MELELEVRIRADFFSVVDRRSGRIVIQVCSQPGSLINAKAEMTAFMQRLTADWVSQLTAEVAKTR